jgi:ketosteroid isomerase-like protein
MPSDTVQRFIDALQASERDKTPDAVAGLFGDDSELANLTHERKGKDGARQFWGEYLNSFGEVRSEFVAVNEADGFAALEWTSTGTLPTGSPVRYKGVSVLETAGGVVRKFRTYYDSAAFVAPKPAEG